MNDKVNDFFKGYKVGLEQGKKAALIEFQKNNPLSDLPNNETLRKIFKLVFQADERMRKTNSCFMDKYGYYVDEVVKNWTND